MQAHCAVCGDQGCEYCPRVEPWPDETFHLLENVDLARLIHDANQELHRRHIVTLELENQWEMNT